MILLRQRKAKNLRRIRLRKRKLARDRESQGAAVDGGAGDQAGKASG